jgi:ribosomal protein L22
MSKKKQNYSVKDEYQKVHVRGSQKDPFGGEAYVSLAVTEVTYDPAIAVARLSIKEAKQVIELLEQAIKDASKKAGKK